ncbi:exonuclease 1 isoform X2 [Phyllopteryx taeniolatus]|uniref:exonuclease 1 isoform X2 n=1 Tax=Phyllopteryx taeniolatus TaxID=161469 RepID=UPI002AD40D94|nr:exonuclease 1 isoform X2 [Phyllopteryx taeniolatus]
MGIPGLLQFIKDAGEPINVKKYKGQTVAVDTYCWLHKGAFSCAEKLAKGELTDHVKPILVFDGRNLPSKREVEKARRERREANLQKGRQLLRDGKLSEARDCFTRCVNITPAMAHNLIKAARARGVDCIVAPYEADAQLAYLTKSGLAHAVITEDSDLLAFGCKKVIVKMDKHGYGLEIDQSNLGRCHSLGNVFTEEKFRYMCIISGCDYLASLHGIGLGKACKLLRLAKDPDILKVIKKMGHYLKMNLVVPKEYIEGFVRANRTFLYQLVFDPLKRKIVPLNPYEEDINPATLSYAGVPIGDDKALQMALGNLDINTMEKIDDFNPDKPMTQPVTHRSCSWNESRVPRPTALSIWSQGTKTTSTVPAQVAAFPDRPPSTRGKERVISLAGVRLPFKSVQVKRPREATDISLSDQDVLQQYFNVKRSKSDQQPETLMLIPVNQPRSRNRFATLLQRRNWDVDDEGQAISSRFFRNSSSAASSRKESAQVGFGHSMEPSATTSPIKQTSDPSVRTNYGDGSEGPEVPSVETPCPPPSPNTSSHSSGSQGLRLFDWSDSSPFTDRSQKPKSSSGLDTLHQFQYKKDSFSSSTKSSIDTNPKREDKSIDSPPSQDSAYFSQSQPSLVSLYKDETPSCGPKPFHPVPEMDSKVDSESEQSPTRSKDTSNKFGMLQLKTYEDCRLVGWTVCCNTEGNSPPTAADRRVVAGLSKPKFSSLVKATKVQALGPARASGLRKKSSTNNENNPGFQATISSLWKNYSFKKDTQKMTSSKKGEAMSAFAGNLVAS